MVLRSRGGDGHERASWAIRGVGLILPHPVPLPQGEETLSLNPEISIGRGLPLPAAGERSARRAG
ncbi:hypothetical protein CHELA1G11_13524 [Hyphomicrobiales bacterium]|nr:hypothetical protein CHELA1G2_10792 [Hyphomicrobiales bacterium]CAH1672278.1 hypothetical protein CHELA1G11_13524 [Hyphomicrobiales bacterium]